MRKSILAELNQISVDRDRDYSVENRADHVINSAINLLEQIELHYDSDPAKDLSDRLVNSIKGRDPLKFSRGIKKVIKESQRKDNDTTR